jgi:hypothetical protein
MELEGRGNMTTTFPIMVSKDESHPAVDLPFPEDPAFQELIDIIQAQPLGPRKAYEYCVEGLFLVSGLLEGLDTGDPETVEILSGNELSPTDLQQLGLWFDQKANEIAKTIS